MIEPQDSYLEIISGLFLSGLLWAGTYRRFAGLVYDLVRLFITAALSAAIVLDFESGPVIVYALELFLTKLWPGGVLVIAYWFIVVSALFFIGRFFSRAACEPGSSVSSLPSKSHDGDRKRISIFEDRRVRCRICSSVVASLFALPLALYYVHPFLDSGRGHKAESFVDDGRLEAGKEFLCAPAIEDNEVRCYEMMQATLPEEGDIPSNVKLRRVDQQPLDAGTPNPEK